MLPARYRKWSGHWRQKIIKMDIKTPVVNLQQATTNDGVKKVVNSLMYGSYRANRGYGMTHEQLISIGIGNDAMKAMYELEQQNDSN